jgi:hypothetical protein
MRIPAAVACALLTFPLAGRTLAESVEVLRSADEATASSIRARLDSREQTNPLGVCVYVGAPRPEGGKCVAPVQVVVPWGSLTLSSNELRLEGEIAIHGIARDDRGRETPVRVSKRTVVMKPGQAAEEALVIAYQPRRYLVSLAIVETLSGEASYLQTEVDATICGR